MRISRIFLAIMRCGSDELVKIIVAGIGLYQKTFSPDHGLLRGVCVRYRCRFVPSCSDYAIQSLRQYGLTSGIMLSVRRIGRCNPFCAGGYDPVQKLNAKS